MKRVQVSAKASPIKTPLMTKRRWADHWSRGAMDSMPTFRRRFLLPPVLQQFWSRETGTVHPGLLPSYQVLLSGPPALLLYISFLQYLSFPTLLLVDDCRPRERAPLRPLVGALKCIVRVWLSLTPGRTGRGGG